MTTPAHKSRDRKNVTFTCGQDLLAKIDELADARGMTRSLFVEKLLEEAIDKVKPVDRLLAD